MSDEALAVARRNADRHAVSERIVFARADGLNLDATLVPAGGFDLLVSNPPYVAEADVDALPRTVRDYEPRLALTAGGSDGLGFYRRFAADADRVLRCGGDLLVEIGAGQLESVLKIFDAAGRFIHVDTLRDPTDPHDRVVHLRCGAPD